MDGMPGRTLPAAQRPCLRRQQHRTVASSQASIGPGTRSTGLRRGMNARAGTPYPALVGFVRRALALGLLACCVSHVAHSQTNIPLQLRQFPDEYRLVINVGIGTGPSNPYMFDTGSSLFNATYNASQWGGVPGFSSLPRNIEYCYTGSTPGNCLGFKGNLVQVPSLTFYDVDGSAGPSLSANPGYQVNATYYSNHAPDSGLNGIF